MAGGRGLRRGERVHVGKKSEWEASRGVVCVWGRGVSGVRRRTVWTYARHAARPRERCEAHLDTSWTAERRVLRPPEDERVREVREDSATVAELVEEWPAHDTLPWFSENFALTQNHFENASFDEKNER